MYLHRGACGCSLLPQREKSVSPRFESGGLLLNNVVSGGIESSNMGSSTIESRAFESEKAESNAVKNGDAEINRAGLAT